MCIFFSFPRIRKISKKKQKEEQEKQKEGDGLSSLESGALQPY